MQLSIELARKCVALGRRRKVGAVTTKFTILQLAEPCHVWQSAIIWFIGMLDRGVTWL